MVRFGNWIFHYRNYLFPLFYGALFIPSAPLIPDNCISIFLGAVFIFSGIAIRSITIGLEYIVRGGKYRQIYADGLVTGGIYGLCRNPMYLGNILLLLGFGFFANSILFIFILFPLFVFFYIAIIQAEESFLLNKFGQTFVNYKNNVGALIPDLRKAGKAFRGHTFKWKRVLNKEHNSLFIYCSGILLLLVSKTIIGISQFIVLLLILSVLYLLLKGMKKKHFLDD